MLCTYGILLAVGFHSLVHLQPNEIMSIKVILFRRVPAEKVNDLKPLLLEMRSRAMAQRGYISGETLMNQDDPEEYLVISSWTTKSRWKEWAENKDRVALQNRIDGLLGRKTMYQLYYNA